MTTIEEISAIVEMAKEQRLFKFTKVESMVCNGKRMKIIFVAEDEELYDRYKQDFYKEPEGMNGGNIRF